MSNRPLFFLAAWIGVAVVATTARADYMLTPTAGGQAALSVAPGASFTLDINLASAADTAWSASFNVDFAQPGLRYLGHAWSAPFETASVYNHSDPNNTETPVVVTVDTYADSYEDPGAVDLHFANFTASGEFTTGKVLSLSLEVPLGFPAGPVAIRALPISIENEDVIPTTGATFTLDVIGPRIWSGAVDNELGRAGNWANGRPTPSDPVIFGPESTRRNLTNGETPLAAVGGITFKALPVGEPSYTLSGTSVLTVSGPIVNNAATAIIDMPIALAGAGGVIDAIGNELTISQPVSGNVGLTKRGAGRLWLSSTGPNTYTGNTLVEEGTLQVDIGINLNAATDDTIVGTTGPTTTMATLETAYVRQDALTINAGSRVTINGMNTSVVNFLSIANGAGGFSWDAGVGGANAAAAVPEPASWCCLAVLLATLAAWRCKRGTIGTR